MLYQRRVRRGAASGQLVIVLIAIGVAVLAGFRLLAQSTSQKMEDDISGPSGIIGRQAAAAAGQSGSSGSGSSGSTSGGSSTP
jgi:hypothetical protein